MDYSQDLVAGASGNAIQVRTGDDEETPLYLNTDRVGIGTSSPGDKLHVKGGYIRAQMDGGADFKLIPHASNDGYGFYDANNTNYDMWLEDGNVGIGTQSPAELLHVSGGNIRLDAGQKINFGGTLTEVDSAGGHLRLDAADKVHINPQTDIRFLLLRPRR